MPTNHRCRDRIQAFICHFLEISLRSPDNNLAIVTGRTSDLLKSDLAICTSFLHKKYFGFTEEEVRNILYDYGIENKFAFFDQWFGGYSYYGGNSGKIFNPLLVTQFLDKKNLPALRLNKCWPTQFRVPIENLLLEVDSSCQKLLVGLLANKKLLADVKDMDWIEIGDREILRLVKPNFLALLLAYGYIIVGEEIGYRRTEIMIPNNLAREVIRNELLPLLNKHLEKENQLSVPSRTSKPSTQAFPGLRFMHFQAKQSRASQRLDTPDKGKERIYKKG